MLIIGLTGGIGTGKSEVARLMQLRGAALVSADQLGHEAYRPNTESWSEVVRAFGKEVVQANGEIDRRKLGRIVFSDPERLAELNRIVHPRIARMVADKLEELRSQGVQVAVVEAALLLDARWEYLVDEVWTTDSPVDAVVRRLRERNGLSEEDVRRRIASQMDRSQRLARSDVVVDNSGDVAALERAVERLWDCRVKRGKART